MVKIKPNELKSGILGNKKDLFAVLAIFLLSLIFFKNVIGTNTLMNNGHYLHEQTFFTYNYKVAFEHGTLPFWTPYWYSGQPLFGDGQVFFLNLTHILMMVLGNIFLSIGLSSLIYLFIAGFGMYFLAKHLIGPRNASFISAVIFMFNGLIYGFITGGNPSILEPYSLMPLIFLCILKARRANNPVNYSILAGILLAFQIFSGGAQVFIYTALLIGLYFAFSAISGNFVPNLAKLFIIGLVVSIVFIGVSAVKLLPSFDYLNKTNRASGVSYQEYVGGDKFVFQDFFKILVINNMPFSSVYIGITAFVLSLISLFLWKKRIVIFLFAASVFTLILGSGGFLSRLFYDYVPVFSQTRHIGRVLFIFVFAIAILAGYGFNSLAEILSKKFNASNKIKNALFAVILLLILTELVAAKGLPNGFNIKEQLEQNELAKYLQQQNEKFRITTFDVTDIVSFYGSSYYAQYGLETLSGGGGVWTNDFTRYLAIAKSYNFSKLSGILNLKYATSTKKADAAGFKLVKKFNECEACNASGWTYWIAGPYLYENEDFLPRYYIVENAVLVVGEERASEDFIYSILLNKNFNPKTALIIQGSNARINDYGINFLKRFNAIILTRTSIDQTSLLLLRQYKNSGGKIFPDILNSENALDISAIESLLSSFKGDLTEVGSKTISQNEIELMPKNAGFLALSERFSGFEEWAAEKEGKKTDILKANGIISSVYTDSPGIIKFTYRPKSFYRGLFISISSIFIIFIYAVLILKRK